jgi:repressor LexA
MPCKLRATTVGRSPGRIEPAAKEDPVAITRRQREILDYLAEFIATRRYSPSLEEIAEHFKLSSVATIHKHVTNLERKGFIRRSFNRGRSIDIVTTEVGPVPARMTEMRARAAERTRAAVRQATETVAGDLPGASHSVQGGYEPDMGSLNPDVIRLPLVGRVAAGRPIEAIVDRETIAVPVTMTAPGRCYVLQVKGDSMIGEHIQDGDYVIVEERQTARDGEKVIALVNDGEATLKTYHRQSDGTVLLRPANPAFDTIKVKDSALQIRGVVIGVMRKFKR